jgi:hypothetical protein
MSDQTSGGLSADEQAYFDSKGEKEIPVEQEAAPQEQASTTTEADAPPIEEDAPAPEGDAEPAAEKRNRFVPHQALHEAREAAKEAKAEAARIREEKARFEETINQRLAMLMPQQPQQPEPQAPPPPLDPAQNPIEFLEQMAAEQRQLKEVIESQQHQAKEREALHHVETFTAADEAQARQMVPDYDQAKEYLGRMVAQQIMIQSGGQATPQQIQKALADEERRIIVTAIMQKERPAKRFYELAKASGWSGAPAQPNGNPAQRIEDLSKAQTANRSLSSAGGGSPGGEMTAEKLFSMSDAEFRAYTAKNPRAFKRLAGG